MEANVNELSAELSSIFVFLRQNLHSVWILDLELAIVVTGRLIWLRHKHVQNNLLIFQDVVDFERAGHGHVFTRNAQFHVALNNQLRCWLNNLVWLIVQKCWHRYSHLTQAVRRLLEQLLSRGSDFNLVVRWSRMSEAIFNVQVR